MDGISTPEISVKIIGHQSFWSHEISDFDTMATCMESSLKYTRVLVTCKQKKVFLKKTSVIFRFFETNKRIALPSNNRSDSGLSL
jgi:hypothetical protein